MIEFCESQPPEMESETIPQFRSIKTHISDQSILLPEEIIEEILSRLPVKSLLKFRCVSKPWRSLIGSKRFTKKHLDYSRKNSNFAHHCIISKSIGPHSEIRQCSLRSMLDDPFTDQFKSCNFTSICPTCVVGCCNGLVCILLESRHFMLWNPSTKMKKNLPAFDRKINHGRIQCYGFGFDELSGDYMVFGILSIFCVTGRYEAIAKVYSLERNSWELVKYKYVSAFGEGGKYASGKLHWHGTMRVAWDIASFDLSSLEFGLVEQPSYPSPDCGFNESMGVIGGCLSMLYDYKTHLDIWIMKEYGLRESWDKVVTVTLVDNPMERLALFAIGPSGEIILMYESNYVIYYPEDNGYRHCQVKNLAPLREAGIYAESLVSLVPYDEE